MEVPVILLSSAPSGACPVKRLAGVPSTKKIYMADGSTWSEIVADAYALNGVALKNVAPTDGYVLTYIGVDTAWEPQPASGGGGGGGIPSPTLVTPPAAGSFTQGQAGSSIATANSQTTIISGTTNSTWYPYYLAAPATPYTLEAGWFLTAPYGNYNAGLLWSDGTKYNYLYIGSDIGIQYNTAVNSFSSTRLTYTGAGPRGTHYWARLNDDGTNRTYYISADGFNFVQIFQELSNTNFTANKIGFHILTGSNGLNAVCSLFHWRVF